MNTRQHAQRPGREQVDPWEQSPRGRPQGGPGGAVPRGVLALSALLLLASVGSLLWLHARGADALQTLAALALLVPAVLLPLQALRSRRRSVGQTLRRFSDGLDPQKDWRDAVRSLRDERSGPSSGFAALASGVETVLGETERRWQALADLSADWYWETDRQHRLSWLSGAAPQALAPGLDEGALIGRRHDQIALFRAPEQGWAALQARMTRLEAFRDVEFQVAVPGRPVRWIAISGRPRRNAQGTVIGFEGVGRDVTERRQAHEQLLASEQRWSTMTRLAADWYWQADTEHRLLPFSEEQRLRVGPELADRMEGHAYWDVHHDALTAEQWDEHRADLEARRPFRSLQMEVEAGEGRWLWISLSGMPRFDAGGRFIGYHGVGRDITARQQAQALLLRHNEALQRAVEERTRDLQQMNLDLEAFSRQLAHELRTPIGQVQGLAQMLASRAAARLQPEDQDVLQLQVQAAQRMRETLDALLSLARSTLQPMPLESVDLSALAQQVADELPALPRRAPLRWHIQLDMRVTANPAALKIVLQNLMGNAAKFTRDSAAPRARVGLRAEDGGMLRISVQDNGAGFDAARTHLLFKPFSRLHARDEFGGSGIGLSIVQRIVERHGGTVQAQGTHGQGACFEFTLPVVDAPLAVPAERPVQHTAA